MASNAVDGLTVDDEDPLSIVLSHEELQQPRKTPWQDLAYSVLDQESKEHLHRLCGRHIAYGSDCSGIDAPRWALMDIFEAIHKDAVQESPESQPPIVDFEMASESNKTSGDAARILLTINGHPRVLVTDCTARKRTRDDRLLGWDAYTGKMSAFLT